MQLRPFRAAAAALMIAGSTFGIAACGPAEAGGLYVGTGPPVPPVEEVVVQPYPNYVWVPGYYSYSGTSYAWVRGHWTAPPEGYRRWNAGHWHQTKKGWHWEEGHWEK